MSKWTLEKILDCEEIKFGTSVTIDGDSSGRVTLGKSADGLEAIRDDLLRHVWGDHVFSEYNFKFYREDGTEILPPEDKPKVKKLYAYRDFKGSQKEIKFYIKSNMKFSFWLREPEYDIEYPNEK